MVCCNVCCYDGMAWLFFVSFYNKKSFAIKEYTDINICQNNNHVAKIISKTINVHQLMRDKFIRIDANKYLEVEIEM